MIQTRNLRQFAGDTLFKTRDILFPVVFFALYALFPPRAMQDYWDSALLIGMALVLTGQAVRILTIGLAYIVRGGRRRKVYAEQLVVSGIFRHCRNPMYLGNILITVGYFAVGGNLQGLLVGSGIFMVFYWLIIYSEERYLSNRFPEAYASYQHQTPKWLPRLAGLRATISDPEVTFDWQGVVVKEYGTIALSSVILLGLVAWRLQRSDLLTGNTPLFYAANLFVVMQYLVARHLKKSRKLTSIRDRHYNAQSEAHS